MANKPTPAEVLKHLFLEEMDISQTELADAIGVNRSRISELCNNKRSIAPDTAIRLSRYFGNSPQFWLNLQSQYDLRQLEGKGRYKHIKQLAA